MGHGTEEGREIIRRMNYVIGMYGRKIVIMEWEFG
jgi:hypothetical protein